MIPYKLKNQNIIKDKINYNILSGLKIPDIYSKLIIEDIINYLKITDGYQNYLTLLLGNKKRNIKGVFHAKRFPDVYAIGETIAKKNGEVFLISHGTHTLQTNNEASKLVSNQLAIGTLYSKRKTTILCSQSRLADDYLDSINFKYIKIKPVESIDSNLIKSPHKKENKLRILHAGSIKVFGSRRYFFESSPEYIHKLIDICNKLKNIKHSIHLTIRVRFLAHNLSYEYLNDVLSPYSDFVTISCRKYFLDDLANADCLIALSSTTLEQSINNHIPCMSLGCSKYDHFSYYKQNRIPSYFNQYELLLKIENLLNQNFVYFKNPLQGHNINLLDLLENYSNH
tara:strand:+ start:81 stop:1103 length:1023 start_codon:yes stop_codon:yes gene_type:complete